MGQKRRSDQPFLPGLDRTRTPRAPRTPHKSASEQRRAAPGRAPARGSGRETFVVAAEIRHADRPSGERRALDVLAARLAEIAADLHISDQLSAERPLPRTPDAGDRGRP
jgi:hypothetical protein